MAIDYFEVGQRVRKYRKAMNISQEQLAELADISVTHMSHIETGNTKMSLGVFEIIASALHVSMDNLLYGERETIRSASLAEISEILDTCNPEQINIIVDVVKATKIALDKHL